jgi:hypothetical protein
MRGFALVPLLALAGGVAATLYPAKMNTKEGFLVSLADYIGLKVLLSPKTYW